MKFDLQLSKSFADTVQRSAFSRQVADICALQLLWFLFGVFACFLVLAGPTGFPTRLFIFPVVVSWFVTMGLEYLIGRPRPFQEQGRKLSVSMLWVPPSFPSGHATISFSLAYLLWSMGLSAWFVYGIAMLVCLGRVAVRVHYFTDVIAGAAVGTLVTILTTRWIL